MTVLLERPDAVAQRTSGPGGTDTTVYGMFTVGPTQVALPLSELREVIPCPPTFAQLPARAVGLVGAVNLRHLVIPVLDLRELFGLEEDGGNDVIVIVAREGYMFGLLADEIRGVSRIPADNLMEMAVGGEATPLFRETFEQPEDGTVVSVLDSAAILALPGFPAVRDAGTPSAALATLAADPDATVRIGDTRRRVVMLLRCGNIGLSIEVNHVHSVIPKLVVRPSPLVGDRCLGVVPLGGVSVPVVDSLQVLGLGELPKHDTDRGLVLSMPRGLVVLAVSDVTNIESVPETDVLPLPAAGMAVNPFLQGALLVPGKGQNLVLDGEALRADVQLDNLANMGMPLAGAADDEPPARSGRRTDDAPEGRRVVPVVKKMLTYNAGVDVASPLVQISEILPYPDDYIPLDGVGRTIQGVFTHRQSTVPLICLTTLLGRDDEVDRATARVLLVDAAGGYVGFIVPALNAIEESVWEEVEDTERGVGTDALSRRLVKVGTRMLPEIDLQRLAAAA
ncbi:chemotaxis protein CheW [Cryptosporangium aurantiacum]|uniref:Purine-binding chemotaxis protein CheW n=1 Tax=Cryptosporangium aurantiacum TaxID=134849 RepID=A0A1M7H3V5_9ACTN|nr:chemotaxis protein CheW [Cryptosporangium aurantiacum]SHM23312.1 purine-binding chemotaxis protein CheW [Cryptosporangium aurantiacum]